MATISIENYLKVIYNLTNRNVGFVSTSLLAIELSVSNAAISEMAGKLSALGYIQYKKYKGVKLLAKGEKIAKNVLRKHRLWELFLIETIGLNWAEVHEEAERLEHCSSDNLIDKIDEFLEFPGSDPHGSPIPSKDGQYRILVNEFPMAECDVGNMYRISRVVDKDSDLINYLTKIQISINKKILVVNKLNFDGSIVVNVDGVIHSLSEKIASNIYLTKNGN